MTNRQNCLAFVLAITLGLLLAGCQSTNGRPKLFAENKPVNPEKTEKLDTNGDPVPTPSSDGTPMSQPLPSNNNTVEVSPSPNTTPAGGIVRDLNGNTTNISQKGKGKEGGTFSSGAGSDALPKTESATPDGQNTSDASKIKKTEEKKPIKVLPPLPHKPDNESLSDFGKYSNNQNSQNGEDFQNVSSSYPDVGVANIQQDHNSQNSSVSGNIVPETSNSNTHPFSSYDNLPPLPIPGTESKADQESNKVDNTDSPNIDDKKSDDKKSDDKKSDDKKSDDKKSDDKKSDDKKSDDKKSDDKKSDDKKSDDKKSDDKKSDDKKSDDKKSDDKKSDDKKSDDKKSDDKKSDDKKSDDKKSDDKKSDDKKSDDKKSDDKKSDDLNKKDDKTTVQYNGVGLSEKSESFSSQSITFLLPSGTGDFSGGNESYVQNNYRSQNTQNITVAKVPNENSFQNSKIIQTVSNSASSVDRTVSTNFNTVQNNPQPCTSAGYTVVTDPKVKTVVQTSSVQTSSAVTGSPSSLRPGNSLEPINPKTFPQSQSFQTAQPAPFSTSSTHFKTIVE